MLNKLSILTRKILLTLVAIIVMGWLTGDLIMDSLPPSVSSSIDNNILLPIKKISTNCSLLNEEIKNDEQCRWSINCTMSRNEQVAYQKRKLDHELFCENK
ncbi:MAG: hypothetical protein ACI8XI_000581 [Woeseiaceae bacterium]|jgi:hypothetical protein|tara:strand:+ start:19870 stop:20172 length:303 start_codon:yes stop_codon:yes gene_type:complete